MGKKHVKYAEQPKHTYANNCLIHIIVTSFSHFLNKLKAAFFRYR